MFLRNFLLALLSAHDIAHNNPTDERRGLHEIYQAALKEDGQVVVWAGGDESHYMDFVKEAFEARFPGITLNITVDLSKYLDGRLDVELKKDRTAIGVDSIILQSVHDFPRWSEDGLLRRYAPNGFSNIYPALRDKKATWYGLWVSSWTGAWNKEKLLDVDPPKEWEDWLRPEFKNRLVLTYPNDDDAVLFAYHLILEQYGTAWLDRLLEQNPRWVRGAQTPRTLVRNESSPYAAYFAASGGWTKEHPIIFSRPKQGKYVTWPQTAAILRDAPHPQGAMLLHNFILTYEFQLNMTRWPVRRDVPSPSGLPYLWLENSTDPTEFGRFMDDRALVERVRFYIESRIGPPQGENPRFDSFLSAS
ncbi:hypothetical protein F66182_2542 [Fusarium sp. NRRL 66182]|nr:hypothetical protein F66182_2542 [Fusarium sp. NRRL 66182]